MSVHRNLCTDILIVYTYYMSVISLEKKTQFKIDE